MKFTMTIFAMVMGLVLSSQAFAVASSVVQGGYKKVLDHGKPVKVVHLTVTANSADGSIADVVIPGLHGFLMKAVTKPGATQPTANYDISLLDPDVAADGLNSVLQNRSASATEVVYPVGASGAAPLWLAPGDYTLHITGNSVNSALVDVWLYFIDSDTRAF